MTEPPLLQLSSNSIHSSVDIKASQIASIRRSTHCETNCSPCIMQLSGTRSLDLSRGRNHGSRLRFARDSPKEQSSPIPGPRLSSTYPSFVWVEHDRLRSPRVSCHLSRQCDNELSGRLSATRSLDFWFLSSCRSLPSHHLAQGWQGSDEASPIPNPRPRARLSGSRSCQGASSATHWPGMGATSSF